MKLINRVWEDAWLLEKILIVFWVVDIICLPFTNHVDWWEVAFAVSMLVHVIRTIMIRKVSEVASEVLNILLRVIKSSKVEHD